MCTPGRLRRSFTLTPTWSKRQWWVFHIPIWEKKLPQWLCFVKGPEQQPKNYVSSSKNEWHPISIQEESGSRRSYRRARLARSLSALSVSRIRVSFCKILLPKMEFICYVLMKERRKPPTGEPRKTILVRLFGYSARS